jgi:hypothetical protein
MHIRAPQESFFDKSVRVANQGISMMGTLKGAYEVGKTLYGAASTMATYGRPLLALM